MSRTIETSIGPLTYLRTVRAYGITNYWASDERGYEYRIYPWAQRTQDGIQLYGVDHNGCRVDMALQIVDGKFREVRATTREIGHDGCGHIYHTTVAPI